MNEAAIKEMKLKNPIGSILKWGSNTFTIVGVINDYINDSPYSPVTPLLIYPAKEWMLNMVVRTNPSLPIEHNLKQMEEILKNLIQRIPLNINLLISNLRSSLKNSSKQLNWHLYFLDWPFLYLVSAYLD